MTWEDKTVIRILLLVAKFVAREPWHKEIEQLSSHISVWAKEAPATAKK